MRFDECGSRPLFLTAVMDATYRRLKSRSREIVSHFPQPKFYEDFKQANDQSRTFFETHPIIIELKDIVAGHVDDNLGHGIHHAVKVTLDAGALMLVEGRQRAYEEDYLNRQLLLVQSFIGLYLQIHLQLTQF